LCFEIRGEGWLRLLVVSEGRLLVVSEGLSSCEYLITCKKIGTGAQGKKIDNR
tara:strand:+ start:231 stop:389 length:159 start_codon:yes stop_codon:yes gene_type:complete